MVRRLIWQFNEIYAGLTAIFRYLSKYLRMTPSFLQQTAFWGITYRQLAWVGFFYVCSAILYDMSISISELGYSGSKPFLILMMNYVPQILFNYCFKILFTLPVWWLFFRELVHLSLEKKVWLHLLTGPLYVYVSISAFYFVADAFSIPRLRGYGQIWDIYISFLLYIVQFGIFHAYHYHKNLQRQQQLEAALRQATIQAELTALKAQINPHFLYNTFNTISASVPPEQEHTRELLAELADMFRYQLQASKVELVTVAEEVAFTQKYLDLEKARFGDRLRLHISVAPEVANAQMLPMILQPLIENAVKHGISPLIEGGEVRLNVFRQDNRIHFEVSDTGGGINQNWGKSDGIGLKNTQLRLEKMYGTQLQITPNRPQGTKISFSIKTGE